MVKRADLCINFLKEQKKLGDEEYETRYKLKQQGVDKMLLEIDSDLERRDSNENTEGKGIIQGQIQLPSQHNKSVNGKMEKVGSQVEETMDILREGIEKIIARADELEKDSHTFNTFGRNVRQKTQFQYSRNKAALGCLVASAAFTVMVATFFSLSTNTLPIVGSVFSGLAVLLFVSSVLLASYPKIKSFISEINTKKSQTANLAISS